MAASIEGQDRVMAAAQQIVKNLNTSKDVADDMLSIFSRFDNRLSNITDLMSSTADRNDSEVDLRLDAAEELIFRRDPNGDSPSQLLPWEDSPDEAADYLTAVDEILELMEELSIDPDTETMDRAQNAIHYAMTRLEVEFEHILTINTVRLNAEKLYGSISRVSLSFTSNDGETDDFESSSEDDQVSVYRHDRGVSLGDDVCVNLINSDAVELLKDVADRMIRSGYYKECIGVYTNIRGKALAECLSYLDVEKLSIEEVNRIEWRSLDEKIKRWIQVVKIVVRIVLSGEKRLCEQIFGGSEETEKIFVDTVKGCVIPLLDFGDAVAIVRRSAEKLFRILDMYDVLMDVLPDLQALFTDVVLVRRAEELLDELGKTAIGTFVEFENAVQGEQSRKPIQGGEIHPLNRYVMNYVKLVVDYSDSMNALLGKIVDASDHLQKDDGENLVLENMSPIARRLLSLITSLESNLEEKSRLYEDSAIQYIFLMNNILYIVQKVKNSDLRNLLGDQWLRKHSGQIRQYATSYLRASWSKVLSCLKDEGIGGSTSNASKMALKERFKNFNACFEDIYRIQTAWKVPDAQLREELRLSILEKVIPAYRSFLGRFRSQLESGRHAGKYIKFTAEDLENYLLDLFEGTPIVLHHMRRKTA